ncbi:MAG: helix-turn-helix transcriptional regulator [Alphaproteobacteria bacterium]|nr:helix-turn-helix transcriptional regulator [Alphaproteobacteria bacterium]
MMTKPSTEQSTPGRASDSILSLVVDVSGSKVAHAAAITSRPEPSKVIHVAFGEWSFPKVDHPDSASMDEFVMRLEAAGHAELLKLGRRDIAGWFDKKPALRSLRLAAEYSQEQLAVLVQTSQPQVARIESGKQGVHLGPLKRLAQVLNLGIHDVVDAAS